VAADKPPLVLLGDCREVMAGLGEASVDAIITDPPYGLSFMGKGWDHSVPGVVFWGAALRVAKPGAHLLAFGGTRTFHRLACAIEDAGWQIRDTLGWIYGSGFPKSLDVSKAIDREAGAEREVVGKEMRSDKRGGNYHGGSEARPAIEWDKTIPATDAARKWDGWGTALKPAWEPIILARKPLAGTVAANVLQYGTGGLNIDGCRVGAEEETGWGGAPGFGAWGSGLGSRQAPRPASGRFPANLIHDGSEEALAVFPETESGANPTSRGGMGYHGAEGQETCEAPRGQDFGSAARFFYCAKASQQDRDEGLEGFPRQGNNRYGDFTGTDTHAPKTQEHNLSRNNHPTVKPTDLMRYLCRLITPPGGTVLDPFAGSGSTGKAAIREGLAFIGIEIDQEAAEIARRRLAREYAQGRLDL